MHGVAAIVEPLPSLAASSAAAAQAYGWTAVALAAGLGASIGNSTTGTRTRVARVKAEYPNQLDYSGHDERRVALEVGKQIETISQEHGSGCMCLKPDIHDHHESQSERPRADLNRDRWIQSPEC